MNKETTDATPESTFQTMTFPAPVTPPPSKAKLFTALAKARMEFDEIPRTRTARVRTKSGVQYEYDYADLSDVFAAVTPGLAAYGLTVSQYPDGNTLKTTISHESGEFLEVGWPIKPMPARGLDDAQSFQSAVQVAKRYALTAALGISTEETVEGDPKAMRNKRLDEKAKADEEEHGSDGVRIPHGAVIKPEMTDREKAEEVARAIEQQMDERKTVKGVNGVWNRNERFITALQERHPDLFENVYDKFHSFSDEGEQ